MWKFFARFINSHYNHYRTGLSRPLVSLIPLPATPLPSFLVADHIWVLSECPMPCSLLFPSFPSCADFSQTPHAVIGFDPITPVRRTSHDRLYSHPPPSCMNIIHATHPIFCYLLFDSAYRKIWSLFKPVF